MESYGETFFFDFITTEKRCILTLLPRVYLQTALKAILCA